MITVVGLGKETDDITQKGKRAAAGAKTLVCRTVLSRPSKRFKNKCTVSFDNLFETSENFDDLNAAIVSELLRLEKERGDIVYCVDGDGFSDASVKLLSEKTQVDVIAGVSAAAREPNAGVLSVSATDFVSLRPLIDTAVSLEITEIDNALLAGEIKLLLMQVYPADALVTFSQAGKKEKIALEELDRRKKYDWSSSAFLAASGSLVKQKYCFADVLRIIERLTAPDGCEWDKAQTHSSIRINMIEEAYEAVAAIINDDTENLAEELGDVLLQSVLHSDISRRGGEFDFSDVVNGLCTKLVTRHTHIFGENKASDAEAALGFWEKAKAKEKKYKGLGDILDSVPECFPALLYSEKVVKKVSKAGYDVLAQDLVSQLKAAADKKEIGKLLFLCVAFAAACRSDAEAELMAECEKFVNACREKLPPANVDVSELLD